MPRHPYLLPHWMRTCHAWRSAMQTARVADGPASGLADAPRKSLRLCRLLNRQPYRRSKAHHRGQGLRFCAASIACKVAASNTAHGPFAAISIRSSPRRFLWSRAQHASLGTDMPDPILRRSPRFHSTRCQHHAIRDRPTRIARNSQNKWSNE